MLRAYRKFPAYTLSAVTSSATFFGGDFDLDIIELGSSFQADTAVNP